MNLHLKISISLFLILILGNGCKQPPKWPEEPELLSFAYDRFDETTYKYYPPVGGEKRADSIILSVNFQDGDANLGLDEDETDVPYHNFDVLTNPDGSTRLKDPGVQFNIYRHALRDINNDTILDTLMIRVNEFSDNFLVDFIEYDILGNLKDTLDFENFVPGGIQNFNGRFMPLFKKDFSENIYEGPLEGTINYTMSSINFPKGIWRFRVRIVDRDLNVSNAILSPPLTIE